MKLTNEQIQAILDGAPDGFIDGYTAGNGYPPSDWEVDQYIKSIKDGEL